MKKVLILTTCLAALAGLGSPLAAADRSEFAVIVHSGNTVTTISREELSKIFLKRLRTWENGSRAEPADQVPESPVREAFSRQIHDRNVVNVEVYWKRMIFSGRSVPPPELRGDAEVVAFVRDHPGAVGYVSPGIDLVGVRRLRLAE